MARSAPPKSSVCTRILVQFLTLVVFIPWTFAVPNFSNCIAQLKDQAQAEIPANSSQQTISAVLAEWGLRDPDGRPPVGLDDAVAISYNVCEKTCGTTQRVSFITT
jgi:hypothetical protein